MNWFQKYTGYIRQLRVIHIIYNYLHRKGLLHNKHLYQFYEIDKTIYQSISHRDFLQKKSKRPWLDTIISEKDIINHPTFIHFPDKIEEQLLKWSKNGYIIWQGFLNEETVDTINTDIDNLLETKKVDFNYTGKKIINAYKQSFTIRKTIKDKRLIELFSFILDKKIIPFQTINFLKGSEQHAHSDAIHMCTFPKGNVLAAWFALEDIDIEQGPISYYSGSHQLPYLNNEDYPNHNNPVSLDPDSNKKYEQKVASLIEENNFKKSVFTAKKGDLFIWHGNLIHGGEPVLNPELTRKSMVVHYFGEGVICYHEISERPAIFDTDLVGEIEDEFYKDTH